MQSCGQPFIYVMGLPTMSHIIDDPFPTDEEWRQGVAETRKVIGEFLNDCSCEN